MSDDGMQEWRDTVERSAERMRSARELTGVDVVPGMRSAIAVMSVALRGASATTAEEASSKMRDLIALRPTDLEEWENLTAGLTALMVRTLQLLADRDSVPVEQLWSEMAMSLSLVLSMSEGE